jgi:hypothetical protein
MSRRTHAAARFPPQLLLGHRLVGEALDQASQGLQAGELRAQAGVNPAAETDVRVGLAADVEDRGSGAGRGSPPP